LDLLGELKSELESSQSEDTDTETQRQADYDDYEAEITATIADKKERLAGLKQKKADLESAIAHAESEQCDEWEGTYQRETIERQGLCRNEEIEVLAQVVVQHRDY
jgi:hypothetical protein